ncbi:MAG: HisA/HisF-related TIM barrel protein [Actinomycetota bacterium]|nr:HisA/HisF-related TIM barrel protein [Actinomycetota bacterium]
MDLYARVNILDGKAVRLPRGKVDDAIFLDADPVERAHGWVAKGADRLLIIDLDAAVSGDYRNRPLIGQIIQSAGVPVLVGGGVRSAREVDRLLDAGAWRIGMGTVAIIDQVLFWEICRKHPGRVVVSLDVRPDLELVTQGWTHGSGRYLEETLIDLSSAGAAAFMISEVGRDALEEPPNFEALKMALTIVDEEVIAAGGVRNLDDIATLMDIAAGDRRLSGVVVGREVTSGRFTVEEAVARLEGGGRLSGPWSMEQLEASLAEFEQVLTDLGEANPSTAVRYNEKFLRWLGGGSPR